MKRWFGPSVLAALAGAACGESRLVDVFADAPTRVRITPDAFLGDVPCARGAEDGLQSYTVSIQVVLPGQLPDAGSPNSVSSPAAACDRAVLFGAVGGRAYMADIVGYDRPASEVDGLPVQPRWRASCGRGGTGAPDAGGDAFAPTVALFGETVVMGGCTTFSSGDTGAEPGRLVIDQASALGNLRCGVQPGEVSRLTAVLAGQSVSAACGTPLVFEIQGPARFHTIELTAYEGAGAPRDAGNGDALDAALPDAALPDAALPDAAVDAGAIDAGTNSAVGGVVRFDAGSDAGAGGVPRWRTQCVGRSVPAVTSTASCEPLTALPAPG